MHGSLVRIELALRRAAKNNADGRPSDGVFLDIANELYWMESMTDTEAYKELEAIR
jgi:hypothetical protein